MLKTAFESYIFSHSVVWAHNKRLILFLLAWEVRHVTHLAARLLQLKPLWRKDRWPLVDSCLLMNEKTIQAVIQSVSESQRYIYTVSAVTYCNHMLIIPSCTEIVPAHSICSSLSLSLFTGFFFFLHPNGPNYSIPLSLYWLPPLVLQTSTNFFSNHIPPPPNDLFHSAYWVHDALHRL